MSHHVGGIVWLRLAHCWHSQHWVTGWCVGVRGYLVPRGSLHKVDVVCTATTHCVCVHVCTYVRMWLYMIECCRQVGVTFKPWCSVCTIYVNLNCTVPEDLVCEWCVVCIASNSVTWDTDSIIGIFYFMLGRCLLGNTLLGLWEPRRLSCIILLWR